MFAPKEMALYLYFLKVFLPPPSPSAFTNYPICLFSSVFSSWSVLVGNVIYLFLSVMISVFLQILD